MKNDTSNEIHDTHVNSLGFDEDAGETWLYSKDKEFRTYQYNIARTGLLHNSLIVLPTGLGKTFIASIIIYNILRWWPNKAMVFMAPNKPLVHQQFESFLETIPLDVSHVFEMNGNIHSSKRKNIWKIGKVFFVTPQILIADLQKNIIEADKIRCIVVDEAHRATGNYAYVNVVKFLNEKNVLYRIIGLSASPGSDVPAVQKLINTLCICKLEYRLENSMDIVKYKKKKLIERIVIKLDENLENIKKLFTNVLLFFFTTLDKNTGLNLTREITSISFFRLFKLHESYNKNLSETGKTRNKNNENFFTMCKSLIYAIGTLESYGGRVCLSFFQDMGNYQKMLLFNQESFKEAFNELDKKFKRISPILKEPDFELAGHPKLEKCIDIILVHLNAYPESRIMIFSNYKHSVYEINQCLNLHEPNIRSMILIGQTNKKGKFRQKDQLEAIKNFKNGVYNVLVSTCVGEEGLDIGDIDLIILFDCSKSAIKLIQREGRTGRKSDGHVKILLTPGREESAYNQSLEKKKNFSNIYANKNIIFPITQGPNLRPYNSVSFKKNIPLKAEIKTFKVISIDPISHKNVKPLYLKNFNFVNSFNLLDKVSKVLHTNRCKSLVGFKRSEIELNDTIINKNDSHFDLEDYFNDAIDLTQPTIPVESHDSDLSLEILNFTRKRKSMDSIVQLSKIPKNDEQICLKVDKLDETNLDIINPKINTMKNETYQNGTDLVNYNDGIIESCTNLCSVMNKVEEFNLDIEMSSKNTDAIVFPSNQNVRISDSSKLILIDESESNSVNENEITQRVYSLNISETLKNQMDAHYSGSDQSGVLFSDSESTENKSSNFGKKYVLNDSINISNCCNDISFNYNSSAPSPSNLSLNESMKNFKSLICDISFLHDKDERNEIEKTPLSENLSDDKFDNLSKLFSCNSKSKKIDLISNFTENNSVPVKSKDIKVDSDTDSMSFISNISNLTQIHTQGKSDDEKCYSFIDQFNCNNFQEMVTSTPIKLSYQPKPNQDNDQGLSNFDNESTISICFSDVSKSNFSVSLSESNQDVNDSTESVEFELDNDSDCDENFEKEMLKKIHCSTKTLTDEEEMEIIDNINLHNENFTNVYQKCEPNNDTVGIDSFNFDISQDCQTLQEIQSKPTSDFLNQVGFNSDKESTLSFESSLESVSDIEPETEIIELLEDRWSRKIKPINVPKFMGNKRMKTLEPLHSVNDYFYLFFTEELVNFFIHQLNARIKKIRKDNFVNKTKYEYVTMTIKLPQFKLFWTSPILKQIKVIDTMSLYSPSENLSIDEGIIKFKGRFYFKTYNPMKPIKVGLKMYICADSSNGFVNSIMLYTGDSNTTINIIENLTKNYEHQNHKLYMDNYFNTFFNCIEMKKKGIYCC
ncbi:hypothetical protein A3Q56_07141, partial [Intoshia linei]